MKGSLEEDIQNIEVPDVMPLLPVRDIVVFPYMVLPLFVGRDKSIRAIDEALAGDRMILLVAQKTANMESPGMDDLYHIGTVGMIMRMLKLPDGRIKLLVHGIKKAGIKEVVQEEPFFKVEIEPIDMENVQLEITLELEALIRTVKEQMEKIVSFGKVPLPDIMVIIENLDDPSKLTDIIVSHLGLTVAVAQDILQCADPVKRLKKLNEILKKEIAVLDMQLEIQSEAKGEMDKTQREYFLREQMKAIEKELTDMDDRTEEIVELRKKIKSAKMPKKVMTEADKQLRRLEKMHPDSAEASTVRSYVECLAELPWSKKSKDRIDIKEAMNILNEDHHALENVKERIIEFLAVRKLKSSQKGPIICFVGAPGVGKTSLGKSIARAMGRKFVRFSLGGMRDEAEIRGHRRTYVGALPGRIIQGIKQAGYRNPIFMLDEIDKLGTDFRGDPSSALLEVLDPEQNNSFTDHYLGVPFDLSEVMFITTANQVEPIPRPLRDRMEIIEIPGYIEEEKMGIAKNYLIRRQLQEHGLTEKEIGFSDSAINIIIKNYTREAGVRNMEREIANVMRKVAKKVAEGEKKHARITNRNINKYLGPPKFLPEAEMKESQVGVATGLAWTEAGGDIIYIEALKMKGKEMLTLTGQLGDVMKESAQAALSYIKSKQEELKIPSDTFTNTELHVHVPAGGIPKDGPSAGITIATTLASVLMNKPVRSDLAMTGEVTLTGRVLPVGGLKEKILAGRRASMKTILIPKRNEKDIQDIPKHLIRGLKIKFVDNMDEVLREAIL